MEQMTPEQAIQEIQTYMHSDCYLDAPSNDACKLAISALEKQVPKKAILNDYCPACDHLLTDGADYCWKCGQHIEY